MINQAQACNRVRICKQSALLTLRSSEGDEEDKEEGLIRQQLKSSPGSYDDGKNLLGSDKYLGDVSIGNMCGSIECQEMERFKKLVFRASRGNTFRLLFNRQGSDLR